MRRVVILGAGPAGVAAALTLLEAHVPVTIIEPERFRRSRPGETLHPGIEPLLNRLGVAEMLYTAGYIRHAGVWSAWGEPIRFVPYGEDSNGPWRGFQAIRSDFDRRLLESTCSRGADVMDGKATRVLTSASGKIRGVTTATGPILASYVMDCSGSCHTLARQLQIPFVRYSRRLIARFGYASGRYDDPAPSIRSDPEGWTWIAEVEPNRFQWTRVTETDRRPGPAWLPAGLQGFSTELPRGADVTWRIAERVAGPGYFLTGDAAAVLDPSSSHGVLRAVMSGMMAAHLAVRHLCFGADAEVCAAYYQEWLTGWFREDVEEMSRIYRVANLFGFGGAPAD